MFTEADQRTLHTQSEDHYLILTEYKHAITRSTKSDEDYATNSQFYIDNHFCIANEVLIAEWVNEECVGMAGSDDYNIPQ